MNSIQNRRTGPGERHLVGSLATDILKNRVKVLRTRNNQYKIKVWTTPSIRRRQDRLVPRFAPALPERSRNPLILGEFLGVIVLQRIYQRILKLLERGSRHVRCAEEHQGGESAARRAIIRLFRALVDLLHRLDGNLRKLLVGVGDVRIRRPVQEILRETLIDHRQGLWRNSREHFRKKGRCVALFRKLHRNMVDVQELRRLLLDRGGQFANRLIDIGQEPLLIFRRKALHQLAHHRGRFNRLVNLSAGIC